MRLTEGVAAVEETPTETPPVADSVESLIVGGGGGRAKLLMGTFGSFSDCNLPFSI
jgi:hypothetical protein